MTFLMSLLLYFNVPWGNRTLNCPLGARIHLGNIYNSELIQVKESLDFSNYFITCRRSDVDGFLTITPICTYFLL